MVHIIGNLTDHEDIIAVRNFNLGFSWLETVLHMHTCIYITFPENYEAVAFLSCFGSGLLMASKPFQRSLRMHIHNWISIEVEDHVHNLKGQKLGLVFLTFTVTDVCPSWLEVFNWKNRAVLSAPQATNPKCVCRFYWYTKQIIKVVFFLFRKKRMKHVTHYFRTYP